MEPRPLRSLRGAILLLCIAAADVTAGCGGRRRGGTEAEEPAATPRRSLTAPIFINVRNNHTADLVLYAVQQGFATRLGSVTAQSTGYFRLPAAIAQSGSTMTLRVAPIGGRGSAESESIPVRAGTRVELMVDVGISRMHIAVYDM